MNVIPISWRMVRQNSERIEALTARVAVLEGRVSALQLQTPTPEPIPDTPGKGKGKPK